MTDDVKPKDFEDALKQLEGIVKELEDGELSLENSLARFEQGVRLARFCSGKLEEAEKRIEMLQVGEDGNPKKDAASSSGTAFSPYADHQRPVFPGDQYDPAGNRNDDHVSGAGVRDVAGHPYSR